MNGHQKIIALRQKGFKPAYVWLLDSGLIPHDCAVTLAKDDKPEHLDLRFLVGTTVLAESQDAGRLERITQACKDAKATRVIASLYDKTPWRDTVAITDTDGEMTWRK